MAAHSSPKCSEIEFDRPEGPKINESLGTQHLGRNFQPKTKRGYTGGFQRLSSSALLTTLTELSAMAAPASTGLR